MKASYTTNFAGSHIGLAIEGRQVIRGPFTIGELAIAMAQDLTHKANHLHGKYNRKVYWPIELELLLMSVMSHKYVIEHSEHTAQRADERDINIGVAKAMLYGEIVEAEICHGMVSKIVTRLPDKFTPNMDICAVILLEPDETAFIKTLYRNEHNDQHDTIKREEYVQGPIQHDTADTNQTTPHTAPRLQNPPWNHTP